MRTLVGKHAEEKFGRKGDVGGLLRHIIVSAVNRLPLVVDHAAAFVCQPDIPVDCKVIGSQPAPFEQEGAENLKKGTLCFRCLNRCSRRCARFAISQKYKVKSIGMHGRCPRFNVYCRFARCLSRRGSMWRPCQTFENEELDTKRYV